ncbi:MAG: hypothetical protein J5735_02780, partial [Prevotella sp.]|nr:hypothetical protein [Prevotella sp.]
MFRILRHIANVFRISTDTYSDVINIGLPSLQRRVEGETMLIFLGLCIVGCSDFSSYNSIVESSNPSADKTLWENISAKNELSDFAQ